MYSPFWALLRQDYERIGYTLLKMNTEYDAGDIYVQGPVENANFERDWHSFLNTRRFWIAFRR